MPEMDGIETARQIRKRIGKEITIIVLTFYEFSKIGVEILQMTGAEVETAENEKLAVINVHSALKKQYLIWRELYEKI